MCHVLDGMEDAKRNELNPEKQRAGGKCVVGGVSVVCV